MYPCFPEGPLVRVHFIIAREGEESPNPDRATLEHAIEEIVRSWGDGLSEALTLSRLNLLIELESDGLTAWGECVAGEHPYFSEETVDTAWIVTETELAPRLLDAELLEGGGSCPGVFKQVRGHRMAKAALENAVWDLEAQVERVSLSELLGGTRKTIPCGVSIGIQSSPEKLMDKIERVYLR